MGQTQWKISIFLQILRSPLTKKNREKKNIFPSRILKEQFLFIPVIIDEKGNDISIFSNNPIYAGWNKTNKRYQLIKYLLPSEDLEDFNLIKEKLDVIETYDFNDITKKYFLKNFKNLILTLST